MLFPELSNFDLYGVLIITYNVRLQPGGGNDIFRHRLSMAWLSIFFVSKEVMVPVGRVCLKTYISPTPLKIKCKISQIDVGHQR